METIVFGNRIDGIEYKERPGSYGIIFNSDSQLAIVKTDHGYFLPGGGKEENESYEECLERELLEEIGYSCTILNLNCVGELYFYSTIFKCFMKSIGYFYCVELTEKTVEPIETDHRLLWVEPKAGADLMYLEHQAWAVRQALIEKCR